MVGERILDRFLIEETIGSGGFGTVYRAWDERLQRAVAVKVIDHDHGAPRVTREAQAVARLTHRNIATLYELATDGERAYLVSELIDGETVRDLGRRGELSDRLVAELGADACAALAHAHRKGVVHRDVKPENILVAAGGEAKLVDFGIARITGEKTLTASGDVVGTLAYMAPEQADGLRPGPAADVYSLALTLYECFCGEHPLLGEGPAATARAIGEPLTPLGDLRLDLPVALTETIDAALDPDPELRPLASELEAGLGVHTRELTDEPLPPVLRPREEAERSRFHRSPPARILTALGVGGLLLAALIATGAPAAVLLAGPLVGVLTLARPRPAAGLGIGVATAWLLLGAGEAGTALLAIVLALPLLAPAIAPGGLPLPGLAPLLGLAGLAPVYPALAGLTRGAAGRALLGGLGYLWLAAFEAVADRRLLLGQELAAPDGWQDSIRLTVSEVVGPLLGWSVLGPAAAWALAAFALPYLIRGRAPVLDALGALIWAAGLISAHRLVAGPGGDPPGLLFAALLAAVVAALVARRLSASAPLRRPAEHADAAATAQRPL
jgi:tRNA A-37 threonylcarbamoyl transferase component Bud32